MKSPIPSKLKANSPHVILYSSIVGTARRNKELWFSTVWSEKSPKIVFLYLVSYYSNSWPVKPVKIHNDLKCCNWYDANIWYHFKPWINDVIIYFFQKPMEFCCVSKPDCIISGDANFQIIHSIHVMESIHSITFSDKSIWLMSTWLRCVFLFEKCYKGG